MKIEKFIPESASEYVIMFSQLYSLMNIYLRSNPVERQSQSKICAGMKVTTRQNMNFQLKASVWCNISASTKTLAARGPEEQNF